MPVLYAREAAESDPRRHARRAIAWSGVQEAANISISPGPGQPAPEPSADVRVPHPSGDREGRLVPSRTSDNQLGLPSLTPERQPRLGMAPSLVVTCTRSRRNAAALRVALCPRARSRGSEGCCPLVVEEGASLFGVAPSLDLACADSWKERRRLLNARSGGRPLTLGARPPRSYTRSHHPTCTTAPSPPGHAPL